MDERISRLAQAGNWYLGNVDAIPADGWSKPTLCEGWTAKHVVAHVLTGDQLVRGLVWDAIGKDHAGQDLPVDYADRQRRMKELATASSETLKEGAHRESEQTVKAIIDAIEVAPVAMVNMPVGRVPMTAVRGLRLNEYIIHGHDLSPAIGRSIPIPDWFIERALTDSINTMVRLHQRSPHKGKSASFHIHRTDGDGEWILRVADGQVFPESVHGKADVALRGPAEGLYWLLMGRGKPEELGVEVHGDPALAVAFKEWFPGP